MKETKFTMTVQDLIDSLNKVTNKNKPVFVYPCEEANKKPLKEGDLSRIIYVDDDLNGRVDINVIPCE